MLFELFLVTLLLWPCAATAESAIHVVVYGDSLVSGYQLQPEEAFAARLDHKFKEAGFFSAQVVNMGTVNETAAEGLQRLSSVLAQRPDIVIVSFGTNDAMRGIDPGRIYQYVASIAQQLSAIQAYVVILEPAPPPSMGEDYAQRLDAVFRHIPSLYKGVQLYALTQDVVGQPDLSLADGIHPNARGMEAMVNGAYPLIDAGLRWKLAVQRYQQQYHGNVQANPQDFMPKGNPPTAVY